MRLDKLLSGIYRGEILKPFRDFEVKAITDDSRQTVTQSLFIAIEGTRCDGAVFIEEAIKKGARIIVKKPSSLVPHLVGPLARKVFILNVTDTKKFLREITRRFYGHPSSQVKTIGITGTNGKTTVSYLIESVLKQGGYPCGVLGTVNYRFGRQTFPSLNTTPGVIQNQDFLFRLAKKKIKYCVMEVSSHALDQGRVDLIDFQCAVFTNLTSDHLDYHQTTKNYFQAKAKLFQKLSSHAYAIINVDDVFGKRLLSMTKAKVLTFAIRGTADIMAQDIRSGVEGSKFFVKTPKGSFPLKTSLIGLHNVYNILAVVGAVFSQGIRLRSIQKGIEHFTCVPGRLERIEGGQDFSVFVDYAHTEDALKNVLTSLREMVQGKIIVVFGCGGDRDKTKRPKMGSVASDLADYVILTNDNPRNEEPQTIVDQIIAGARHRNYEVILDREEAIQRALHLAKTGDIVLIAGKGHEDYQIFKDKKIHFDDREIVRKILLCQHEKLLCH